MGNQRGLGSGRGVVGTEEVGVECRSSQGLGNRAPAVLGNTGTFQTVGKWEVAPPQPAPPPEGSPAQVPGLCQGLPSGHQGPPLLWADRVEVGSASILPRRGVP